MKHVTIHATPEEQCLLEAFRMLPDECRQTSVRYMEAFVRRMGERPPSFSLIAGTGAPTLAETTRARVTPTLRLVREGAS